MVENFQPIVGDWYSNAETGEVFEVVAVDDDGGSISIQYYSGDVAELDADTWGQLILEPSAPPEDWAAPFDDVEKDERGYDETWHPENWSGPFTDLDRE